MKRLVKYQKLVTIENKRAYLGGKFKIKAFKKTYSKGWDLKENLNTGKFWDKRHVTDLQCLEDSPIYKDKIHIVSKWLKSQNGHVLDIGLGNGEIERLLQRSSLNISGIDISKESVKRARVNFKGNYKQGSIYKIPFKKNTFDFVLALDVLEHLPASKVFKAYNEVSRVIKKGGIFIISVPLNEGLDKLLSEGKNPNGHMRMYQPETLKTELMLAGYEVIGETLLTAFRNNYFFKKTLTRLFKLFNVESNLAIFFARKL